MQKQQKVTRLLASTVDCKLEVDGGHALELKLAWTMRSVIAMERRLREQGIKVNIVQNPGLFWKEVDAATLAAGLWACATQAYSSGPPTNPHLDYGDDEGYSTIESFITPENSTAAYQALRSAFLESLSEAKRKLILEMEAELKKQQENGEEPPSDPTPAPPQAE